MVDIYSQNIDDSPISDNNTMDISERTTISQESLGLSPETEQKTNSTAAPDSIGFLGSESHSSTNITSKLAKNSTLSNVKSRTSNRNYSDSDQHDNKFDDSSLDNRILVSKNEKSKQRIGLTLVDMHPLMVKSDDEDFSPDSSITFESTCQLESEFANTECESPMHVSPMMQRFNTLCLPNKNIDNDKLHSSSGESEPDISQYQASVEPTFQSVSLTNFSTGKLLSTVPKMNSLRKIPLTAELMVTKEDDSSIETISNNSFDDDIEDEDGLSFKETKSNIQSASNEVKVLKRVSSNENPARVQQPASAVTVTLPNGQIRDIDMKVIEPYKRCLSHGGYIKSPGHNAIVIFSACYLPDRSRADYHYVMENLFLYVSID